MRLPFPPWRAFPNAEKGPLPNPGTPPGLPFEPRPLLLEGILNTSEENDGTLPDASEDSDGWINPLVDRLSRLPDASEDSDVWINPLVDRLSRVSGFTVSRFISSLLGFIVSGNSPPPSSYSAGLSEVSQLGWGKSPKSWAKAP